MSADFTIEVVVDSEPFMRAYEAALLLGHQDIDPEKHSEIRNVWKDGKMIVAVFPSPYLARLANL